MNYKPILFSTPMVQAILEGRKTMTRRVIKTKYSNTELVMHTDKRGTRIVERLTDAMSNHLTAIMDKQPKYNVSDILWVRETWRKWDGGYSYKADALNTFQWRPSIHMPKAAARIFLRVTDVRGERLQDITEADAICEGTESIQSFNELWNTINAKRGYGWDKNPWVWVYSFECVDKPEGWPLCV